MQDCLYVISLKKRAMHNFSKSAVTIDDNLREVGKKLHSPKKEFFAKNKDILSSLYNNYDDLAAKDKLHTLQSHFSTKSERTLAYELYGSERPFVNAQWENLTRINGGETLFCPICGLNECEEMDHFVPREEEKFPEYSAHLSNLIPLCHSCNHKKSDKFLNDNKDRIYFNAFYDTLRERDIIQCTIELSTLDGFPQIKVKVNPSLYFENKPDKYILSTIRDLELLPKFLTRAKSLFKKEINRLKSRVGQPWDVIKKEMLAQSTPVDNDPDIIYPAVLKAIGESEVMKTWFNSL